MAEDIKATPELKLFHATITIDVVVLATSEDAAMKIANDEARKHDAEVDTLREMDHYPAGWDGGCLPFGHRDPQASDRTLEQWIEAGAAPKYLETKLRLQEARNRFISGALPQTDP